MKILKKGFLILMVSVLLFSGTLIPIASADDFNPTLPPDPVTLTATDGTLSYFDIFLSNVPSGYDVTNGQYLGWCAQLGTEMPRGQAVSVMLYSSYDPGMPVSFQNENWDKINYILNHKIGTDFMDVQRAIWYFLEGYLSYRPDVLAMRDAADMYGDGYYPQSGEVIAILADGGSEIQRSFFEILVPPEEYEGLTPGFWKNHLDAWQIPYDPNDSLVSLFSSANQFFDDETMLDALEFTGGPRLFGAAKILLRAAVAALLNAAHLEVNYPLTQTEIINQVNNALDSTRENMLNLASDLDSYNNYGCDDL